jgi:hypothetical protein
MDTERKTNAVKMLRELKQDCFSDTRKRDAQPFTGRNVAEALGEICAQIDALATVLIAILEEDNEPNMEETVNA